MYMIMSPRRVCRFEPVVQASPSLIPDGFIYLRATPDICMGRMKRRSRQEELGVDVEYLQGLHQKHEDWLKIPPPAAVDWRNGSGESLPERIRNGGQRLSVGAYAEPKAIQGKVCVDLWLFCLHSANACPYQSCHAMALWQTH